MKPLSGPKKGRDTFVNNGSSLIRIKISYGDTRFDGM